MAECEQSPATAAPACPRCGALRVVGCGECGTQRQARPAVVFQRPAEPPLSPRERYRFRHLLDGPGR